MSLKFGKFKNKDGNYEEDKTFPIRVFDGGILKACFVCKNHKECNAKTLEECVYSKKDRTALHSELMDKEKKED